MKLDLEFDMSDPSPISFCSFSGLKALVSWQGIGRHLMGSSCHPKKNIPTVHDFGDSSAFRQTTQLFETAGIYFLWTEYAKMKCSCLFLEKLSWSVSFG